MQKSITSKSLKHIQRFQHRTNFLIHLPGLDCINHLSEQDSKLLTELPKTDLWLDITLIKNQKQILRNANTDKGKLFPALQDRSSRFLPAEAGFTFGELPSVGWLRRAHFVRFVAESTPLCGAPQLLFLHPRQLRNCPFTRTRSSARNLNRAP